MEGEIGVEADSRARDWMENHPSEATRVIAYEIHRCCGGGAICRVSVRPLSRNDRAEDYAHAAMDDGRGRKRPFGANRAHVTRLKRSFRAKSGELVLKSRP